MDDLVHLLQFHPQILCGPMGP